MIKTTVVLGIILFALLSSDLANALCIKVPKANVRTGPGTKYKKAWEVYKYMPFSKVGVSISGDWYAVKDIDGDVNWVHKEIVTDKFQCAAVKKKKINVRTGPGTKFPKSSLSPATQYYSFKVIKKKSVWVHVQDESNETGWIHSDFLWIQ
jgi:SH3-like domain-containing protein